MHHNFLYRNFLVRLRLLTDSRTTLFLTPLLLPLLLELFPLPQPFATTAIAQVPAPQQLERDRTMRPASINAQVTEVVDRLVGVMATQTPASTGRSVTVHMTTCPIQVVNLSGNESSNASSNASVSVFLYQEQALVEQLNQPYRQRFLQILPTDDQQVESRAFRPRPLESWINLCDRPLSDRTVTLSDMEPMNCSVFLQRQQNNLTSVTYVGVTPAGGCATNFHGAVRITNEIHLFEQGMETRDRGYDAEGNLVWGAREEPYRFRKIPD